MRVLREVGSNKVFAITLDDDDGIICIPADQDPEEETIKITLDRTEVGVPINQFIIPPIKCREIIKQMHQGLIKTGWKLGAAKEFLTKGI